MINSHLEIDVSALRHNVDVLRGASGRAGQLLCAMVKGNAYGHGLLVASQAFVHAGVDWLGIGELDEARQLREAGIHTPTYCVCPVFAGQAEDVVALDVRVNVVDQELVAALDRAALAVGKTARVHIKVETGTNRQGVAAEAAVKLADEIGRREGVVLEGCSTHFADIEDTTDHGFAQQQAARFRDAVAEIRRSVARAGGDPERLLAHASNTAALLLWPDAHDDLLRFGIGAYGMWPSKETYISARSLGRAPFDLRPALRWVTAIAQVKDVAAGQFVGYGRTFRTVRPSRIAILPIGYYDGYDRGLSGVGAVLVAGQRAPVVGRIAMNMVAIDVTDNAFAEVGAEVVLLGEQAGSAGTDRISASEIASLLGTIHYEVTTRIHPRLPRKAVGASAGRA